MAILDNLVAYWTLDETSGTRNDSHGTNHLSDNNTVLSGTGKQGNAADFEQPNVEWLNVADNTALSMGDIDFTVAFWLNGESFNDGSGNFYGIFGKSVSGGGAKEYHCFYSPSLNRFRFAVCPDGNDANTVFATADTLGAPSTGTWYFVICQYDATNNLAGISVNNGTLDTASESGGAFNGSADFLIGRALSADTTFDGMIDEFGVWKRLLTSDEKTYLYNGGNGRTYSDLATPVITQTHYRWRNDDGSETTATWAAAEDTEMSAAQGVRRRLRVQCDTNTNRDSEQLTLQYRKVGDPATEWRTIT